MAVVKFLHILSLISLAVLHASFDAVPVNALALDHGHVARGLGHAHADIVKKRDSSSKCRPRPSPSANAGATTTPAPYSAPSSQPSQPASTTTSSQLPPAKSPSPSGDGSKIILGWNNNELGSLKNILGGTKPSIFNWNLKPTPQKFLGPSAEVYKTLEFVPSVSDRNGIALIKGGALNSLDRWPTHLRGFNEPEIDTQANLTVPDAYKLWTEHVAPLAKQGIQLLAPAVTSGSKGLDWLTAFMDKCNGQCGISLLDVHFYIIDSDEFIPVVTNFHNTFNLDIWITEFGCMDYSGQRRGCPQDVFNKLYSAAMSFVEDTEWIKKVGWFSLFTAAELPNGVYPTNAMITCPGGAKPGSSDCSLNDLGHAFIHGSTTP